MAALEKMPVEVNVPEWAKRPRHLAGCMPFPIENLMSESVLEKLVKDSPRLKLQYVQDIAGGIRTAHLHVADAVVLLDRERFKTLAGKVAAELAESSVEAGGDYVDIMNPIGNIYGGTLVHDK